MANDNVQSEQQSDESRSICRGDKGENVQAGAGFTNIDLKKPGDVDLVYRAVLNGWDTPQHIRNQICDQLVEAMDYRRARADEAEAVGQGMRVNRENMRIIKIAKMALAMNARNMIDEGMPAKHFPYVRKRTPDRRQCPRGRRRDDLAAVKAELTALLEQVEKLGLIRSA